MRLILNVLLKDMGVQWLNWILVLKKKILNQILTQSLNVSQTEERIETYLRI